MNEPTDVPPPFPWRSLGMTVLCLNASLFWFMLALAIYFHASPNSPVELRWRPEPPAAPAR